MDIKNRSWNEWRKLYEQCESIANDLDRRWRDGLHDRRLRTITVEFRISLLTVSITARCKMGGEWLEVSASHTDPFRAGEIVEQAMVVLLHEWQDSHRYGGRRHIAKR